MFWFMTILTIYIVGGALTFFGDAYFDGTSADDPASMIPICMVWFLIVPIFLTGVLYKWVSVKGRSRREKKAQLTKFRIAEEAKAEKILKESEQEVENFVEELQQKNR